MATRKESLEQQMQEQEFLESQLAELEAAIEGVPAAESFCV